MSRSPFGWAYPAGAEHDPNAPWNQEDMPETWCEVCDTDQHDDCEVVDGVQMCAGCIEDKAWDDAAAEDAKS